MEFQTPAELPTNASAPPDSCRRANSSAKGERKSASWRAAAETTRWSRKIAAGEKLLAERLHRHARRVPETLGGARQLKAEELNAFPDHPRGRSVATPRRQPWPGCLPSGEHSNHSPNSAQPCKGCRAAKGRGLHKASGSTAARRSAREIAWTDPSRLSYDDNRTARRGQGMPGEVSRIPRGERWGPEPGVHRSPW